jgi:hypothetical protein
MRCPEGSASRAWPSGPGTRTEAGPEAGEADRLRWGWRAGTRERPARDLSQCIYILFIISYTTQLSYREANTQYIVIVRLHAHSTSRCHRTTGHRGETRMARAPSRRDARASARYTTTPQQHPMAVHTRHPTRADCSITRHGPHTHTVAPSHSLPRLVRTSAPHPPRSARQSSLALATRLVIHIILRRKRPTVRAQPTHAAQAPRRFLSRQSRCDCVSRACFAAPSLRSERRDRRHPSSSSKTQGGRPAVSRRVVPLSLSPRPRLRSTAPAAGRPPSRTASGTRSRRRRRA